MKRNKTFTKVFGDGKLKVEDAKPWRVTTKRVIHEDKSKRHPRHFKHKENFSKYL